jgi:hypothetical protein
LRAPFRLAVVELEHAEWLVSRGQADRARELLADAEAIFDRLDATPWRERARMPARG